MGVARSGLWSPDFNTEYLHSLLLFNRLSNCLFLSLRHRRNQTLVKSVCETAPESLLWVAICVPGFDYAPLMA